MDLPPPPRFPSPPPSAEERVALKANGGNKHRGITSVNSRKANEQWTGLGGWRERVEASSRRYYTANVNMAADVFRKARISPPGLLILVIGATYTPDALNVRKARQEAESSGIRGRDEWFPA